MKAVTRWDYRPFVRFDEPERALGRIFRLRPSAAGLFEWFDKRARHGSPAALSKTGSRRVEVEQQIPTR